jgi:hypothetical protein
LDLVFKTPQEIIAFQAIQFDWVVPFDQKIDLLRV